MGGRRHILHDVIRKSETVTLTVGDKSASKTVVLEEPIDIYLEIDDNPYNSSVHDCSKHIESCVTLLWHVMQLKLPIR